MVVLCIFYCFQGAKGALKDKSSVFNIKTDKRRMAMNTNYKNNFAGIIKDNTLTCFDDTVCTECVIPDGVTTIAADAFKGCTRLQKALKRSSLVHLRTAKTFR